MREAARIRCFITLDCQNLDGRPFRADLPLDGDARAWTDAAEVVFNSSYNDMNMVDR